MAKMTIYISDALSDRIKKVKGKGKVSMSKTCQMALERKVAFLEFVNAQKWETAEFKVKSAGPMIMKRVDLRPWWNRGSRFSGGVR